MEAFLARHQLPAAFIETATRYYMPFAEWLEQRLVVRNTPGFVLGINGAQGTGKTTLASFLRQYMRAEYGRSVAPMSIDDFYLAKAERDELALAVHPLLATRGVPGTHDIELGISIIDRLRSQQADEELALPRFDKSMDDRKPERNWPVVQGAVDLIILEGWCVGSTVCDVSRLSDPVNELEANEDPQGDWRAYINMKLATEYREFFERLDALLFLEVPNFEVIYKWRLEQEHKLRAASTPASRGVLSDAEVARFIQHFERITRNNLLTMPLSADAVIRLGDDHQGKAMRLS
ncbi:MAG TPA: kinase [Woeseiaceae bacterium]|nr:kinase [Woeseiaceae bacterium]